jgi:alkylation response protein AidB-like acyl-CoA dehydrogenase
LITFELSEEQLMAQSAMQDFASNVLAPAAQRADRAAQADQATLDAMWQTGIVQSQVDQAESDRSAVLNAIILEEFGAGDASLALALAAPLAYVRAVAGQGSQAQRAALSEFAESEVFLPAAVALMEPHFGWNPRALKTVAKRVETGWQIDGVKTMVPFATTGNAKLLVIAATAEGSKAFIVDGAARGLRVIGGEPTLGLRCLQMGAIALEGVLVGDADVLGEGGAVDVQAIIDSGRVGLSAVMTGLSRGITDYVIPYTKDRVAHGSALARKQVIAFRIADMHIETNAMRWMSWRAACDIENATDDATRSAQLAYTYASGRCMSIADEALQAFGGHGYVRAHPIEMWYRNARAVGMLEGLAAV